MCALRARLEFDDREKTWAPFVRWRLRSPLVEQARLAHIECRRPNDEDFAQPPDLVEEEEALWRRAVGVYLERCGAPARDITPPEATTRMILRKRSVSVGGAVDLLVETESGGIELRQFELWGRPLDADPTTNWEIALAVLRIARRLADSPLMIRHIDLIGDVEEVRTLDLLESISDIAAMFDARIALLRTRIT